MRRKAIFFSALFAWTAFADPSAIAPRPFVAYAWSGQPGAYEHIIKMHWLAGSLPDPAGAKEATDAMPEGHRVLFSWDLHRWYHTNRNDFCRDAGGNLTDQRGIWWDHGTEEIAQRFNEFFQTYKEVGGQVDALILDTEVGLSNWSFGKDERRWRAVMADPRFDAITEDLGFSDLLTVMNWQTESGERRNHYKIWNVMMQKRAAAYVNQAIYEPVRKHFPNITLSDWEMHYNRSEHACPDHNGHDYTAFGIGTHVGTHQSGHLYGWIGQLARRSLSGGTRPYGTGPFAGFRYSINRMRSMKMSSGVPVRPWISHKGFKDSLVRDSDLYQELIFHAGLTGPDAFLLWNPVAHSPKLNPDHYSTGEQDQRVNDCLAQLTQLAGAADRVTLVTNLAGWYDDSVLTGMRAGGRSVWRFTPQLEPGQAREAALVQSDPPVFRTQQVEIRFDKASIHEPERELSEQGFWILAPPDASPVVHRRQAGPP